MKKSSGKRILEWEYAVIRHTTYYGVSFSQKSYWGVSVFVILGCLSKPLGKENTMVFSEFADLKLASWFLSGKVLKIWLQKLCVFWFLLRIHICRSLFCCRFDENINADNLCFCVIATKNHGFLETCFDPKRIIFLHTQLTLMCLRCFCYENMANAVTITFILSLCIQQCHHKVVGIQAKKNITRH